MNTAANIKKSDASHWYYADGSSCYTLPKKSGPGLKVPTLADARELQLIPSVTTILRILHKPALQDWLIEQSVLAVLTTPRHPGEQDDAFIRRVLHDEKVQDQEAKTAADRGTMIHDAIASHLKGEQYDPRGLPYVEAVLPIIKMLGRIQWTEKNLAGDGYAGRSDILLENDINLILLDFKSAKTMPTKDSWPEHRLQTAAYAKTLGNVADKHVITGNIYLSTVEVGKVAYFLQEDWLRTYEEGFMPLVKYWQFSNDYIPGGKP